MPNTTDVATVPAPVNVVALDQENHALVAVINGAGPVPFDPVAGLAALPAGGGLVIADGNAWSVRNPLSASQYCWPTAAAREQFLAGLAARGYTAIHVANKLANTLYLREGLPQADAVLALSRYAHTQIARHGRFDSGHPVRDSRGDISFGQREQVTVAFLRLQNTGGYATAFTQEVITIAWHAFHALADSDPARSRALKKIFGLAQRTPALSSNGSPNKVTAVACCTHDPDTGTLRTHAGAPWGREFITRRIIGLSGAMRGTGALAPGNPMRAVLRALGRRHGEKINAGERSLTDAGVRILIRALQEHPQLPTARP